VPAFATAAPPGSYTPKPHQRCRAHYVRRTVIVHRRRHGKTIKVRRARCVYVKPKPQPKPPPVTTTQYGVSIAPTFTQGPISSLQAICASR
jgi:hypothetical protein